MNKHMHLKKTVASISLVLSFLGIASQEVVWAKEGDAVTVKQQTREDAFHKKFRTQFYSAYPTIDSVAKSLKTSGYNQFENPTGIVFEAGDTAVVTVQGDPGTIKLELRVTNFGTKEWKDSKYQLRPGKNTIQIKNKGHGYISYYTDQFKRAPKLKISIEGGRANGYFDSAIHDNKDWKILLTGAVSNILDH